MIIHNDSIDYIQQRIVMSTNNTQQNATWVTYNKLQNFWNMLFLLMHNDFMFLSVCNTLIQLIPRSHSCCLSLSLCLEWYNRSITPRVHSGVTKSAQCRLHYNRCDRVISVLNHCLEWDKFAHLTLAYPTPDSCFTYTNTDHFPY